MVAIATTLTIALVVTVIHVASFDLTSSPSSKIHRLGLRQRQRHRERETESLHTSRHNHNNNNNRQRIKSLSLSLSQSQSQSKRERVCFVCESCGAESIKWVGRCPHCLEWNSVKPFKPARVSSSMLDPRTIAKAGGSVGGRVIVGADNTATTAAAGHTKGGVAGRWLINSASTNGSSLMLPLSSVSDEKQVDRFPTFSKEFDRVMGGGIVKGSVTLIAGEPGIGKSTLLLQLAASLVDSVVYLSGEENPQQIAMRSKRLHLHQDNTFLMCDVDIDVALSDIADMSKLPSIIIVDSIQTMRSSDCDNSIGSVTQIRDCTAKLVQFAKATGIAVVLVGHVTKSGDVAGPRVLEHMVDTVLYMEGSEKMDYRLVKCHKNRFGSVSEVGVFTMSEEGMLDVNNPSELFVTTSSITHGQEGSAVVIIMEGSRPLLAEIQCLVGTSHGAQSGKFISKRASDGFPMQRLLLICAVIEKRLKLSLWNRDVYLNVVGGLRLSEPSADAAVAAAIISSVTSVTIRPGTAFIGELGLGGELRGGKNLGQRIAEAVKVGFKRVIVPFSSGLNPTAHKFHGVEIVPCSNLKEVIEAGLLTNNVDDLIASQRRRKSKVDIAERDDNNNNDDDDDEDG